VAVDDPLLPAAQHLMGPEAAELLGAAVEAFGGRLEAAQAVQVQHRPGHDLVVRYDTQVAWGSRPPQRETLLAAALIGGAPEGTLVLSAGDVEAAVWRYPYDPRLPGLAAAVTPGQVDEVLDGLIPHRPELEVVAYRPIRRAVVRATTGDRELYLKVVRPKETAVIAGRHDALAAAGLPVPRVLRIDESRGLLVMEALTGENLRDRLLGSTDGWPPARSYLDLLARLAEVELPPARVSNRLALTPWETADSHARALTAILPREADRLARITDAIATLPESAEPKRTVHGDLYEAQLMVEGGDLSGLLDLDDVGPGGPLDDPATLLAHLHILRPDDRRHRDHLRRHRLALRAAFVEALCPEGRDEADHGAELDLRTAAILVGLATGPFRAQSDRWQAEVRRRIGMAARLTAAHSPDREKTLRKAS
jgi:aminoglycoside phosphotransferase (APT) family kinase protein